MKTDLQSILPNWALHALAQDARQGVRTHNNVLVVDVIQGKTAVLLWWYNGHVCPVGLTDTSLDLLLKLEGSMPIWKVERAPLSSLLNARVFLRTDLYITSLQVPAGPSPFVIQHHIP